MYFLRKSIKIWKDNELHQEWMKKVENHKNFENQINDSINQINDILQGFNVNVLFTIKYKYFNSQYMKKKKSNGLRQWMNFIQWKKKKNNYYQNFMKKKMILIISL